MNKAILIGRLTKNPEMRTTSSGISATTFTIAVNRNFKAENGEREADFINCVAWKAQAESIAKYMKKGSQIAVQGRIQTRSYDAQDGTKRYVTEVIVEQVEFLGSSQNNTKEEEPTNNKDAFSEFADEVEISDADLPF